MEMQIEELWTGSRSMHVWRDREKDRGTYIYLSLPLGRVNQQPTGLRQFGAETLITQIQKKK